MIAIPSAFKGDVNFLVIVQKDNVYVVLPYVETSTSGVEIPR